MPKKSFHAPKNHRICHRHCLHLRVHQTAQKQMAVETEKLYRWLVISTVKSVIQVRNASKESAIAFQAGLAMERLLFGFGTMTCFKLLKFIAYFTFCFNGLQN